MEYLLAVYMCSLWYSSGSGSVLPPYNSLIGGKDHQIADQKESGDCYHSNEEVEDETVVKLESRCLGQSHSCVSQSVSHCSTTVPGQGLSTRLGLEH